MWIVGALPVLTGLVAWLVSAQVALVVLAGGLVGCFIARLVRPEPQPAALVVRRRGVDLTVLGLIAVVIAVIALSGTPGL